MSYRILGLNFKDDRGNFTTVSVPANDVEKIAEIKAFAKNKGYEYNPRDYDTDESEEAYRLVLKRLDSYKEKF